MWTCSALQQHPNAMILCDDDATLELRVKTVKYFKGLQKVHAEFTARQRASLTRLSSPRQCPSTPRHYTAASDRRLWPQRPSRPDRTNLAERCRDSPASAPSGSYTSHHKCAITLHALSCIANSTGAQIYSTLDGRNSTV